MTPADLATLVKKTAESFLPDPSILPEEVTVERPRNPEHGDYATNVALQVAKKAGMNPRDLGQKLADALSADPAIESAEILSLIHI